MSYLDSLARSAARRLRRWRAEDAATDARGRGQTLGERSQQLGERSDEMRRHSAQLASRGSVPLEERMTVPLENSEQRDRREADESEISRELDGG